MKLHGLTAAVSELHRAHNALCARFIKSLTAFIPVLTHGVFSGDLIKTTLINCLRGLCLLETYPLALSLLSRTH